MIRFDEYRAPGWILVAIGAISFCFILFFRESSEDLGEDNREDTRLINSNISEEDEFTSYDDNYTYIRSDSKYSTSPSESRHLWSSSDMSAQDAPVNCLHKKMRDINGSLLLSVLFVFFAFSTGWSLIETILTPLTRDTFGMGQKGNQSP